MKTYYEILGAPRRATPSELKSAYRRKAAETHPDRTDGRVDEFRSVCVAWDVLRDPARREEYDARLDLQFRAADGSSSSTTYDAGSSSHTTTTPPPPPTPTAERPTATPRPSPGPADAPWTAPEPVSEPVAQESAQRASGRLAGVQRLARSVSRRGMLVGTLVGVFMATSGLGVWWIADGGRLLAIAAGAYVAGVAVVLGMRWWGQFAPIGIYRLLMKACWGLVALWALVAAGLWVGHRDNVYVPVVVAAAFALFGVSVVWLWRLAAWRFAVPATTTDGPEG